MREGRPRAVRSRPGFVPSSVAALLWFFATASGCATEVNTLGPAPDDTAFGGAAGSTAMSVAGKAPVAGSKSSGGSGGTGVNAFGGTANAGGKPTGGAAGTGGDAEPGGSGGSSQGGMTTGGTASNGGKAGGGGSTGESGGSTGGGGASGGSAGGGNLECLSDWKGSACDSCSNQTQSDKLACVKILDCYAANACGPATCAGNDDKCGANKIGQGTAGYPIAKQVYDCACP